MDLRFHRRRWLSLLLLPEIVFRLRQGLRLRFGFEPELRL
jgi:hypothetical protein